MHVPFMVKGGLAEALLQPAVSLIAWYLECGQFLPLLDSSSSPRTALPPNSFPWRSFGWRQSEEGSQKTHMSLIWSITTRSDHHRIITIRSEGKPQKLKMKGIERSHESSFLLMSFLKHTWQSSSLTLKLCSDKNVWLFYTSILIDG